MANKVKYNLGCNSAILITITFVSINPPEFGITCFIPLESITLALVMATLVMANLVNHTTLHINRHMLLKAIPKLIATLW